MVAFEWVVGQVKDRGLTLLLLGWLVLTTMQMRGSLNEIAHELDRPDLFVDAVEVMAVAGVES